jgi:hypothetical protein
VEIIPPLALEGALVMRHLAIVPVALLLLVAPALSQEPASTVGSPIPSSSAVDPRGDVDTVVARLMTFDRNNDGKVAIEELPERMRTLLTSGSQPLDREALRSLATQSRQQTIFGGLSGSRYGFGDVGFPSGDTTSSLIEGAIDDLRLPAPERERALAIGQQFVDTMKAHATAALLATVTPVLSPTQLQAFRADLARKIERHTIETPDGGHATLILRPNLELALRSYGLSSSQLLQAIPSLQTYEESLRFDDRRRATFLARMRSVLSADDLTDLEAALQRRPLVKNVIVLTTNSTVDTARIVTQFATMRAAIANQAVANLAID